MQRNSYERNERLDVEHLILQMAGIVYENRQLRVENAELRLRLEEHEERLHKQYKESEECYRSAVGIALKGALNGESGPETAQKILEAEVCIKMRDKKENVE